MLHVDASRRGHPLYGAAWTRASLTSLQGLGGVLGYG